MLIKTQIDGKLMAIGVHSILIDDITQSKDLDLMHVKIKVDV